MFNLVATVLIIALIAAVLGFGGIAFAACAVPRVGAVRRDRRAAASPLRDRRRTSHSGGSIGELATPGAAPAFFASA